jgi:hypothetical protein
MAFARMFNNPNVNKEQYDEMIVKLRVNDNPPDGAVVHIAGEAGGNWRVIEVWESEEHAAAWDAKLEPALAQAGIVRPAPEKWQVHNLIQA